MTTHGIEGDILTE